MLIKKTALTPLIMYRSIQILQKSLSLFKENQHYNNFLERLYIYFTAKNIYTLKISLLNNHMILSIIVISMSAFSEIIMDVLSVVLLSALFVERFDLVSNEVCSKLKNSFQPYVRAM